MIETIAEDLLGTFKKAPLLDAYDVFQHLMDYWDATMRDDCYLIAGDGWHAAAQPRLIIEEKGKKTKAKPDLVVGKKKYQTELIPPVLIIQRWFASQQAAIEKLEAEVAALQQQMEELAEEHGGEDGLLAEAVTALRWRSLSSRTATSRSGMASGSCSPTSRRNSTNGSSRPCN